MEMHDITCDPMFKVSSTEFQLLQLLSLPFYQIPCFELSPGVHCHQGCTVTRGAQVHQGCKVSPGVHTFCTDNVTWRCGIQTITLKNGYDHTDVLATRRFALLDKSLQWNS